MERPSLAGAPRKHVVPPAVLAQRMQRYAVYLIVAAFLLMAINLGALSVEAVLWFASGLSAVFGLLCAIAVVILNGMAWNFDRMTEEFRGRREAVDIK